MGRTIPDTKIRTYAKGGESYHNYGLAGDLTAMYPDGKTVNEHPDNSGLAAMAKARGFGWGGDWAGRKYDPPHFERTFGYTPDQLRQMTAPGARYPFLPGQRNR